jgi:hypothetical protein
VYNNLSTSQQISASFLFKGSPPFQQLKAVPEQLDRNNRQSHGPISLKRMLEKKMNFKEKGPKNG